MSVASVVSAGTRNAYRPAPRVDRERIESILRRANRRLGRGLGRIEWIGSLESYIRHTAEAMVDGWTVDDDYPVAAPDGSWRWSTTDSGSLARLVSIEDRLWASERAAHSTAR